MSRAPGVLTALRDRLGERVLAGGKLARYTGDSSVFRLTPCAAIRPRWESDVQAVLAAARDHHVPVVARAGGSNTGGAAITDGLLLLFDGEEFSNTDFDATAGTVSCGPAVRHDRLQALLQDHGLWLPSDPSSGPLSCVGGNINTRASGPHALRHGAIHNYLVHVRMITACGAVVDTREPASVPARYVEELRRLADRIGRDSVTVSRLNGRRETKWASGYELLALVDHADDPVRAIPRLVAGSAGTLGILTAAVLRGEPRPTERAALLLRFTDARAAALAATELRHEAAAVEFVSRSALDLLRRHTEVLAGDDDTRALVIVEYSGSGAYDSARAATHAPPGSRGVTTGARELTTGASVIASSEAEIEQIWKARKALLPVTRRFAAEGLVPYSIVNDVGVPPERLVELLDGCETIFSHHGLDAAIYGHAGSGNLHLRPLFPAGDVKLARSVASQVYGLVCRLDGTITAEHGMGRLRAPFLRDEWGDRIVGYMRDLKRIFDPDEVLNPGVVFTAPEHDFAADGWELPPVL